MQGFDSPVRIVFRHYRKRIIDVDNVSGKAAVDGLVAAGILENDSPKYVKEIQHVQVKCGKGEAESTHIQIQALK